MNISPLPKQRLDPFWRGFVAILPLWLAAAPFGLAYAIAAREAQLNNLEIQLMSLTVFSAAAQLALVQMLSSGSSLWLMLSTMLMMNVHHFLYGLSLGQRHRFSRWQRLIAAFVLTDAAYGLSIAEEKSGGIWFLFGAELSMFTAWNLFTGLGLWFGSILDLPPAAQLNFIVPLTFFLLLVSVVKTRTDLLVAVGSVGLAIFLGKMGMGNTAVLLTGIIGSAIGLGISARQERVLTK